MLKDAPFFAEIADAAEGTKAYWTHAEDGVRLRIAHFPAAEARGTVLLFPGRTEYVEKYGQTARDFAAQGLTTLAIDWRGQGIADRVAEDPMVGHVGAFSDYQRDVAAMVQAAEELQLPKPWFLLAHSMGGCIGLRALVEGLPVAASVFSGPMWGIQIPAVMRPVAWAITRAGIALGQGEMITPGTKPESHLLKEPFEENALTTDREMYGFMQTQVSQQPGLQLGGPTLRWLNEALSEMLTLSNLPAPQVPCICFMGSNERIVDQNRIRARMAGWNGGELAVLPGLEHEVLMEDAETRRAITARAAGFFWDAAHKAETADAAKGSAPLEPAPGSPLAV